MRGALPCRTKAMRKRACRRPEPALSSWGRKALGAQGLVRCRIDFGTDHKHQKVTGDAMGDAPVPVHETIQPVYPDGVH